LLEGKSAKELQRSVDEDKNYHDKELVDHLKRMENAGNMEELDTINGKVPRYGIGDDSHSIWEDLWETIAETHYNLNSRRLSKMRGAQNSP